MARAQYAVVYSDKALSQLSSIYHYVLAEASQPIAEAFVDAIMAQCNALRIFPHRGKLRNDLWPVMRVINYKGRTLIAFQVDERDAKVIVAGIFYGGQDHSSRLLADAETWRV